MKLPVFPYSISIYSSFRAIKFDPLPSLPVVINVATLPVKLSLILDNGICLSNLKLMSVGSSSFKTAGNMLPEEVWNPAGWGG